MGGGKKRDRWESSSDEEEEKVKRKKSERSTKQTSTLDPSNNRTSPEKPNDQQIPTLQTSHNPLLQGCRSVYDTYEQIARISEGTYGIVWKARDLVTQEMVALKQIKFNVDDNDSGLRPQGFPVTALREISVLLALSHESIVSVREMVVGAATNQVFMVMECFDGDLSSWLLSSSKEFLAPSALKSILHQIVSGLHHMHSNWYLHRDMKPSNLLVQTSTGRVALADLGLARRYEEPARAMTQLVVTLWYRSPELLFGEDRYGPPVDMWSVGCILAELVVGKALMQGHGELDQLDKIFAMVGHPNETSWPEFDKLPNAGLFRWKQVSEEKLLPQTFPLAQPLAGGPCFLDSDGYSLLENLLCLDPSQRLTSQQALDHNYFQRGVQMKRPKFAKSS